MNIYVRLFALAAAILPSSASAGDGCLLEQLFAIPRDLVSNGNSRCCPAPVSPCRPVCAAPSNAEAMKSAKPRTTSSDTHCAYFWWADWGNGVRSYYGEDCSNNYPINIDGFFAEPLTGHCGDTSPPNCFSVAFINKDNGGGDGGGRGHHRFQKEAKLKEKFTPGQGPKASGGKDHHDRVRRKKLINKPMFVKFTSNNSEVFAQLWLYEVSRMTATPPKKPEKLGIFAVGQEIDPTKLKPSDEVLELVVKKGSVEVASDHVAYVTRGNITWQVLFKTDIEP